MSGALNKGERRRIERAAERQAHAERVRGEAARLRNLARIDAEIAAEKARLAETGADRLEASDWIDAHERLFALHSRRSTLVSIQDAACAWMYQRAAAIRERLEAEAERAHARAARAGAIAIKGAERDKPTRARAGRSAGRARVTRDGAVQLGGELPLAVRRMVPRRISDRDAEALAMARADYLYGFASGGMVGRYDVGVDGGGKPLGGVEAERLAARWRWETAAAALSPSLRAVLVDVLIREVALEEGAGAAAEVAGAAHRCTATGVLFVTAARDFAEAYRAQCADRGLTRARGHM